MASTRSGAKQTLRIAEADGSNPILISGPETGYSNLSIAPSAGAQTQTSAGLTSSVPSGHTVRQGSFTVNESAANLAAFLGRNGRRGRADKRNQGDGTGLKREQFDCILGISRAFGDRGLRQFSVTVYVDGDIDGTAQ